MWTARYVGDMDMDMDIDYGYGYLSESVEICISVHDDIHFHSIGMKLGGLRISTAEGTRSTNNLWTSLSA